MEITAPASYAARLSAMGGESRRSSFGAPKLTMKELNQDGGILEKVFAISKPSQVDLYNTFKVVSSLDDEHFQLYDEVEDEASIKTYLNLCNVVSDEARDLLRKERFKIILKLESLTKAQFNKRLKSIVPPEAGEDEDLHKNYINGVVGMTVQELDLEGLDDIINNAVNQVLGQVFKIQDAIQEVDIKESKAKTMDMLKVVAARGLSISSNNIDAPPSHLHFLDSIKNMKTIYDSYLALDMQFKAANKKHEEHVSKLTQKDISEEDQDEYVKKAGEASLRADGLKKLAKTTSTTRLSRHNTTIIVCRYGVSSLQTLCLLLATCLTIHQRSIPLQRSLLRNRL